MKKAIVIGGSRGIGKSISIALQKIGVDVTATSRKEIDTSDIKSVKKFINHHKKTDILVLNTGGPPKRKFATITEKEWLKFHNQLFLGFCVILQKVKINNNGFLFLITSGVIREPESEFVLSVSYRLALTGIFKILSKEYARRNVSCINIAPGPIYTDRMKKLVKNLDNFQSSLPMKRVGNPDEIGSFVSSIVEKNIKYLTGTTVLFDGGISKFIF